MSPNCNIGSSSTTTGISDHNDTYVEITSPMLQTEKKLKIRSYKSYNKDQLRKDYLQEIEKSNFDDLVNENKINETTALWMNIVSTLCD